ncbi:MAG TPA: glyoxalase [Gammaproteobacteria bacterium]|nr:glyoxalase [Gammaproteobacteria bacterium]
MIQPSSAFPVFIIEHLGKAKTFYGDHFDFNVVFQNEWYLHLAAQSGIQVGFMLPNQATQPDIFHAPHAGDGVIFSLEVNDADSAYTHAKNSSLDIVLALRSEEWGQRHFSVKDPNGIYVDIVQATEPSEEYQEGYNDKQKLD